MSPFPDVTFHPDTDHKNLLNKLQRFFVDARKYWVASAKMYDGEGGAGGLDHNALTNLTTGDAHTQYLHLTGRAGGQVVKGGTGSGDDLTLQTTSHATKGSYILPEMTTAGYLKNTAAGVVTGGNDVSTDMWPVGSYFASTVNPSTLTPPLAGTWVSE